MTRTKLPKGVARVNCKKCNKLIVTYNPSDEEKFICEKCYVQSPEYLEKKKIYEENLRLNFKN